MKPQSGELKESESSTAQGDAVPVDLIAYKWAETLSESIMLPAREVKRLSEMITRALSVTTAPQPDAEFRFLTRDDAESFISQHLHSAQWEGERLIVSFEREALIEALVEGDTLPAPSVSEQAQPDTPISQPKRPCRECGEVGYHNSKTCGFLARKGMWAIDVAMPVHDSERVDPEDQELGKDV